MARRIVGFNWIPVFTAFAIIAISADVHAQRRPFQIGNIFSAGGGQGVRIGGPRLGMQFGGGQGAIFGNAQYGMQFGGGRGAHFGGPNYGMQFGGGQGAQLGRLNGSSPNSAYPNNALGATPTPYVPPSDSSPSISTAQNFSTQPNAYATKVYGQSTTQPVISGGPPNSQSNVKPAQPTLAPPRSTPSPADQNPSETEPTQTETNRNPNSSGEMIKISFPETAGEALNYSLNGSRFIVAPGHSFALQSDQTWVISFSPTQSATEKKYTLDQPGDFTFKKSDTGWDLFQIDRTATEPTPTADPKQESPASQSILDVGKENGSETPGAIPGNVDKSD